MRVVGIMLLRNEDLFVEQALRNILSFCDEVLITDHRSQDRTPQILARLQQEFPERITLHPIAHPRESHELIRPYAGTDTWIFGVDGDEIYDPAGLARFRAQLEHGDYADQWALFGNVLNVKSWDTSLRTAQGHLAPPCRSMTKLYNFRLITDWRGRGCIERLHGGTVYFKPGFHEMLRVNLHEQQPWDAAAFRCLHLCFLRRSSRDAAGAPPRKNIMDVNAWTPGKIATKLRALLTGRPAPDWKEQRYARGPLVSESFEPFFPQDLPVTP